MDKLYSKQILILKAVCCFLLAPLSALLSFLISVEDGFMYILLSVVPIGCLYTVPFWASLAYIKKYLVAKIGKYAIYDSITCLIPAIFGALAFEIIFVVINGKTAANGFVTLIFSTIFLIVSLIFWLMYWIFSYKK
ncbi:MAG: hypothetical protein J6Q89_07055 [Clostridia bacterium]|nr:hypothetical protein [Clostridia bacterium]